MPRAAILNLLLALPILAAHPSNPAGVLSELTIANFSSSGQTTIQAIATDPSGNLYVAGSTNSFNFPVKNAAQPVIGESRILRSTDLGATWTRMGLPPTDVTVVTPDPVSPQIIFAEGSTAIFRSTDGGQSWSTVYQFNAQNSTYAALVIDPGNHLRIATLLNGNIVRSLDGGNTWTIGAGICLSSCEGGPLIVDPSGSGALIGGPESLRISRDWGATVQEIRTGIPGTPSIAAFDPSNPGWIYVDTTGGASGVLALSMDFGATWTQKGSPAGFTGLLGLQVDPDQPTVLVATTPDGIYKSSDGANSWVRQVSPFGSPAISVDGFHPFALVSHKCSPNGGLFAIGSSFGGGFHIAFSPDDGITWKTPQLSGITNVAVGPNCVAYVTRTTNADAFIAKLSSDGTVQWATYLGGSDQDSAAALAVDAQGNAYITGNTTSPDFPSTVPLIGVTGQSAVFVTKFSPDGTIAFSAVLSGETVNVATAIAVDRSGSVYVAGETNSVSFPLTPGALFSTIAIPTDFTGYLTKLSSNAALVFSTFLGTLYTLPQAVLVDANNQPLVAGTGPAPGLPSPPANDNAPAFVVKLNQTATQAVSGAYLQNFNPGAIPSAMALDASGDVLVFGSAYFGVYTATAGAYASPPPIARCENFYGASGGDAFLSKLDGSSLQTIYAALIRTTCGIIPRGMTLDSSGAPILAMATSAGLTLRSPIVAGPACGDNSNAIVKLSADGSSLAFATYLDGCGAPAIALASNGSIYSGAASSVLNLNLTNPPFSVDGIANAFSGDPSAVAVGGLYTLIGTGFPPVPNVSLPLNPTQNLPTEIEGVEVLFDGQPAQLLEVSSTRIIVAAPERLIRPERNTSPPEFTSIRISYKGSPSAPVWMPVTASLPGIFTTGQFDPGTDGYVQNQDGSLNSASNPAAKGSTITLFVTGMGATTPSVASGNIASSAIAPDASVFASWRMYAYQGANPPETVQSIPGFIASVFQIPLSVPSTAATGRVALGLQFGLFDGEGYVPPVSNLIGIYVK
jgi:uncharacterized protein (TIGR03437 family)